MQIKKCCVYAMAGRKKQNGGQKKLTKRSINHHFIFPNVSSLSINTKNTSYMRRIHTHINKIGFLKTNSLSLLYEKYIIFSSTLSHSKGLYLPARKAAFPQRICNIIKWQFIKLLALERTRFVCGTSTPTQHYALNTTAPTLTTHTNKYTHTYVLACLVNEINKGSSSALPLSSWLVINNLDVNLRLLKTFPAAFTLTLSLSSPSFRSTYLADT